MIAAPILLDKGEMLLVFVTMAAAVAGLVALACTCIKFPHTCLSILDLTAYPFIFGWYTYTSSGPKPLEDKYQLHRYHHRHQHRYHHRHHR